MQPTQSSQAGEPEIYTTNPGLFLWKCGCDKCKTLTVAAADESEAKRIYRRFYPKAKTKTVWAVLAV